MTLPANPFDQPWRAAGLALVLCLLAPSAWAQPDPEAAAEAEETEEAEEAAPEEAEEASAQEEPPAVAPAPPPPAPPPPAAAPADEDDDDEDDRPDHVQVVGRIGVSWFGVSNVPIATGSPAGTDDDPSINIGEPTTVPAPALGIRYWFNHLVGLDVGLGFSISTGSMSTTVAAADKQTVLAFLYHLGVPLSVVDGQHVSLQIIPEINFGHAHSEVEPAQQDEPPPAASLSGFRFDLGARVGGEVQFGFIDLPELALEGSVGVYASFQGTDISVDEVHASENNLLFATAEYQSPWDFFTQHLRARYYF